MGDDARQILQQYVVLTEFLGKALGPSYEVVLHDLTDKNRSVIAVANAHISGRSVGAPLTNMALSILRDKSYENSDYRLNYFGLSANGKVLRSNTMFIKHEGEPIGMLCINYDGSRVESIAKELLSLVHPDSFLEELHAKDSAPAPVDSDLSSENPEKFCRSSKEVAVDAVHHELAIRGLSTGRLSTEDKLEIVAALDADGIFLLKGVVHEVAEALSCSDASMYRYLAQVKKKDDN